MKSLKQTFFWQILRVCKAGLRRGYHRLLVSKLSPWPISFAQSGEDMLVWALLSQYSADPGTYVDVGAHHPWRWSNTYFLYLRGWRGVCIEPARGARKFFELARPQDRFIEAAIGAHEGMVTLHVFEEQAVNCVSADEAAVRVERVGQAMVDQYQVRCIPLASALDQTLPPDRVFDLLSVDVEGMELEVLQSNDWSRYRPNLVLVEDNGSTTLSECEGPEHVRYLLQQGYLAVSRGRRTTMLARQDRVVPHPLGWWLKAR